MRPEDIQLAITIKDRLNYFNNEIIPLPGIGNTLALDCLIEQIIDSIKRIKYIQVIKNRNISSLCCDANSIAFDPYKAAIYFKNINRIDESFWLVFLATHFGKNIKSGWGLVKALYGGIDHNCIWNWEKTKNEINVLREWFRQNNDDIERFGAFGNHRKYQSLDPDYKSGTWSTIASYVEWIDNNGNHLTRFEQCNTPTIANDPKKLFNALYKSMSWVNGFGRTAKFDYLTMIGKLGLLNIEPDATYLHGATGPLSGAKLLFTGSINTHIKTKELEEYISALNTELDLFFGMQVLEDSLCNWQKNPNKYIHFRG